MLYENKSKNSICLKGKCHEISDPFLLHDHNQSGSAPSYSLVFSNVVLISWRCSPVQKCPRCHWHRRVKTHRCSWHHREFVEHWSKTKIKLGGFPKAKLIELSMLISPRYRSCILENALSRKEETQMAQCGEKMADTILCTSCSFDVTENHHVGWIGT